MMTYRLQQIQRLHCDLDTAWKFFSSPDNLAAITPPEMNFTVLTETQGKPIYEGMTIEYKVRPLLNIPVYWRTKITQVAEGRSFTDFQEQGPYRLWRHFHEFFPDSQGILMKDTVDYALPYGLVGKAAHGLFIRRRLQEIFDYRYDILEQLFNQTENKWM